MDHKCEKSPRGVEKLLPGFVAHLCWGRESEGGWQRGEWPKKGGRATHRPIT